MINTYASEHPLWMQIVALIALIMVLALVVDHVSGDFEEKESDVE